MSKNIQSENEQPSGNDPRTNEELISAALAYSPDDDSYWDVVWTLHYRDKRDVLRHADALCQSAQSADRRLGADILRLGKCDDQSIRDRSLATLLDMLEKEEDANALQGILIALDRLEDARVVERAARFRRHPDARVRNGSIEALMGHEDQLAVECLIELSRDVDAHNRDWATFGLGSQISLDTPAIREALNERLSDSDFDARSEAIAGLADRGDPRVIPAIVRELTSGCVETLAVEAAAIVAAPELLPHLLALRKWWDVCPESLEEAIQACSLTSNHQ